MTTLLFTGATGFIGGEALSQALAHPSIKQVISLQRRETSIQNPKLKQVLLKTDEEWTNWPAELKSEVGGVDGVVWSLGILPTKAKDDATSKRVGVDYTNYALSTILAARSSSSAANPLRFVYVSGSGVVRDQEASLWIMSSFRKLRGLTEIALLEAHEDTSKNVNVSIARPSGVIGKGKPAFEVSGFTIGVQKLGAACVELALRGQQGPVSNKELIGIGEKALKELKGAEK